MHIRASVFITLAYGFQVPPMRTHERTFSIGDDAAPVDMLTALFEARGWPFSAQSRDEMSGEIQGSWAKFQVRAIWRAEDKVLQILCLPDVRVSNDKWTAACELLAKVNEQIWMGHFDVWSNGGVLVYRNAAMLGGDGLLSLTQAQNLIEAAVEECDRFYPAFQFVLWGDKTPADALESAMIDAAGEA